MADISKRFPKIVPVHGVRVPVKWQEAPTVEIDDEEVLVYGYYQWLAPQPEIVLHAGMTHSTAMNTFAHEVLHAWFAATGILEQKDLIEEVAVRALTPLLVQLLKEWKKNG